MKSNGFCGLAYSLLQLRRVCCGYKPRLRVYSTAFSPLQPDQVQVKVGSSGTINLDIYHPLQSPHTASNVIIYLPRGPVFPLNTVEPASLLPLATSSNSTVVRLNYRLSKEDAYPRPVHDVLAGYDWAVRNLVQGVSLDGVQKGQNLAVCGEFVGGSLAAALALTECRKEGPAVGAVVMGNPISDWTSMYPVPKPVTTIEAALGATKTGRKKRAPKLPPWEAFAHSESLPASALIRARSSIFRIPEDYFDVFASPMLFFRTPGIAVPQETDPLDEIFLPPEIAAQQPAKKKRSHRKYPSADMDITLPHTRVIVGEKSILKDQGIELAERIAHSFHSYGGPLGTGEGSGWEKVEVDIKPGIGAWTEDDLVEIGSSLRTVMNT